MMFLIRKIRGFIVKSLWPKSSYFLATKSVKPLSRKFGFDRGTPIDRFWIKHFLNHNSPKIHGRVLEIVDNTYTTQYGHRVTKSDVLDLNLKNKKANIYGNLKHLPGVSSNTYDCILLTQVLGMIDDYDSALSECQRILRPGGTLLITSSCFAPLHSGFNTNFWRFTPASLRYVLEKHFSRVQVTSYGNVLTGQCFWVGMSAEELTGKELSYQDPYYPCLVGAVCQK